MKKQIIFVGRDGRPSMKKVYSQMSTNTVELQVRRQLVGKQPYIRLYQNNVVDRRSRLPIEQLTLADATVIRWGNRIEAPTNKGTVVYNTSEAIAKATNKKTARQQFLKAGVRAPKLFERDSKDITFPVIARPLVHSKGKNFVVLNNLKEFKAHYKEGWYYSEFIDKQAEFRVHCGHGKVLAVMEKPAVKGQIAWNRAINHEAFVRVKQEDYIYSVCFQALKAVESLGLDFGGVDVVVLKNGDKPEAYVLEINTAPTLNSSEWVSSQYAKYFDWLFASEKRKQHWDFKQFKAPASFAWKQDQFKQ